MARSSLGKGNTQNRDSEAPKKLTKSDYHQRKDKGATRKIGLKKGTGSKSPKPGKLHVKGHK